MAGSEKLAKKRILVTGGDGLVGSAIRNIASEEEFREDEEWIFVTAHDADLTYCFIFDVSYMFYTYRVFQKKTAGSFPRDKFGTVRYEMEIFAPKCSAEITVYQSVQNCGNVLNILLAGSSYTSA